MPDPTATLADLDAARDDFHAALSQVDHELVTVPGVVGEWSVRDLVVHVAAWAEHATRAIDAASAGRADAFTDPPDGTDAMNDRILAEARGTSPAEALERESSSFAELRARVAGLTPEELATRLGNGDTVEEVVRYDGPDHYAEHAAHLRDWFGADEDQDEDATTDT